MKVLVDSSVWIGFFSRGMHGSLENLIEEDLICTNDIILTELVPFMHRARAFNAIKSLQSLEKYELDIHWPSIIELQILNLSNGINNVGIPDLIICTSAIENNLMLWTEDKHFSLMEKFTALKTYSPMSY